MLGRVPFSPNLRGILNSKLCLSLCINQHSYSLRGSYTLSESILPQIALFNVKPNMCLKGSRIFKITLQKIKLLYLFTYLFKVFFFFWEGGGHLTYLTIWHCFSKYTNMKILWAGNLFYSWFQSRKQILANPISNDSKNFSCSSHKSFPQQRLLIQHIYVMQF